MFIKVNDRVVRVVKWPVLPNPNAEGMALSSKLIAVRKGYWDSHPERKKPILRHETYHTEQFASYGWFTFVFRYLTSKAFRAQMETEAEWAAAHPTKWGYRVIEE